MMLNQSLKARIAWAGKTRLAPHLRIASPTTSNLLQTRAFKSLLGLQDADGAKKNNSNVSVVVPTKLPFGEGAPRFPHMQALPLVSRPLFPGLVTTLTLTDQATISALEKLLEHENGATGAYISCFLRKKNPTGVSEGGVILSTPEVISSPDDLYHTGTLAQIQRLTRGVLGHKPTTPMNASENDEDEDTAASLLLLAHRRVDLKRVDNIGPPIEVTVSHWPRLEFTGVASKENDTIRALSNEILSTIREVAQRNPISREFAVLSYACRCQ